MSQGQIRVGRRVYDKKGGFVDPSYPGFTSIIVLTKSSAYGSLGPYVLKDKDGNNMENLYQASKVYRSVPSTIQRYSRWDKTVIWSHPGETHVDNKGNRTQKYYQWRKKLQTNSYAIRYPLGWTNGKANNYKCLYAYRDDHPDEKLDYIQTRKLIYIPLYSEMVQKEEQFLELKERLEKGENLLIIEVDGPHQEDLSYYKDKYKVDDSFIENNTVLVTQENIKIMLNDPKHPYGHGYVLATTLLGKTNEWLS